MTVIQWDQEDMLDPENDLCVKYDGQYVDIIQDHTQTWRAQFKNVNISRRGFNSRSEAMECAEQFVEFNYNKTLYVGNTLERWQLDIIRQTIDEKSKYEDLDFEDTVTIIMERNYPEIIKIYGCFRAWCMIEFDNIESKIAFLLRNA